jgi:hypothetical protein
MTEAVFTSKAWALYEKLPRPALRWVCLVGALWAIMVCDIAGMPLDSTTRGVIFTFVAAVYGLRGWEKLKENSNADLGT